MKGYAMGLQAGLATALCSVKFAAFWANGGHGRL
jgi:hypothetical protein